MFITDYDVKAATSDRNRQTQNRMTVRQAKVAAGTTTALGGRTVMILAGLVTTLLAFGI